MTKKTSLWLALAAIIFIAILAALFMSGALHGAINKSDRSHVVL